MKMIENQIDESIEAGPGFLLWQVSTAWRRQIETALYTSFGVTYSQFVILANLAKLSREGRLISQVEIAKYCGTNVTMTSQILRTLEAKGFIERKQRKGDEKSKFPQVTQKGEELIEKAIPLVQSVDRKFFAKLQLETDKYIELSQKLL